MAYIPFTDEQKRRANSVNLVDFLQRQGEQLTRSGREWRWKRHDSVTIRGNRLDENGISRHAHKRGTYTQGEPYKGNVEGSDPSYSFHWIGESDTHLKNVVLCLDHDEASIEAAGRLKDILAEHDYYDSAKGS